MATRLYDFQEKGGRRWLPVKANVVIKKGEFLGNDGGYARPLVAGDEFLGIAETEIDNTGGINGTYETKDATGVLVASYGIVKIDIAASTFANLHDPVYASGANTAVLVATSNSLIGKYFNKADGAATAAWLSFDAR